MLDKKRYDYVYMSDVYIYVEKDEYKNFIDLLKKYNVGCLETDCVCKEKYTLKVSGGRKGDVILRFSIYISGLRSRIQESEYFSFSFGEKLFNFQKIIDEIKYREIFEDKVSDIEKYKFPDCDDYYGSETKFNKKFKDYYKILKELELKMYESLPFTPKEYYIIKNLDEFDFNYFIKEYTEKGMDLKDIYKVEEFYLEPSEPEEEYMNRVSAIFDIIDNSILEKVRYPEDESIASINIDLSSINKEVKKAAKDNNLNVKINKNVLSFEDSEGEGIRVIRPCYTKDLKDIYPYLYDDSKLIRIIIARELRKTETKCFY